MGRKQKPYQTSWGEIIPGLYHAVDGRWKDISSGKWFTEHDEREAIRKFRQLTAANNLISIPLMTMPDGIEEMTDAELLDIANDLLPTKTPAENENYISEYANENTIWEWFRNQLLKNPSYIARMTNIPQLAHLDQLQIPKPPIRIDAIIESYQSHCNASTEIGKKRAVEHFKRLVKFCNAKTLADLTEEKLVEFRQWVVDKSEMKSSGTISQMFSTIRGVLRVASRGNLDPVQIDTLIQKCKAKLYSPQNNVVDKPCPISRENFHKLLNKAKPNWKAMLLMALNCALYMEDICQLKWEHIKDDGTFISRRNKKGKCLRVAVLWKETLDALAALPKNGSEYVFVSSHGTRYNKNSRINRFAELRDKAEVPSDVTWSHIRDGAYTVAFTTQGIEERFARILVGHKASGDTDKYVLRKPSSVKPACESVHAAYFG